MELDSLDEEIMEEEEKEKNQHCKERKKRGGRYLKERNECK